MTSKYLCADESGNFDFRSDVDHRGATRYFAVGTLMFEDEQDVQTLRADPLALRDELARAGQAHHDAFHATEDRQYVRDAVFEVLACHAFKANVTLLEKAKAQPLARPGVRNGLPRASLPGWVNP